MRLQPLPGVDRALMAGPALAVGEVGRHDVGNYLARSLVRGEPRSEVALGNPTIRGRKGASLGLSALVEPDGGPFSSVESESWLHPSISSTTCCGIRYWTPMRKCFNSPRLQSTRTCSALHSQRSARVSGVYGRGNVAIESLLMPRPAARDRRGRAWRGAPPLPCRC